MKPPIQWSASHDDANHAGVCEDRFYRVHVREGIITAIHVDPIANPPYQPIGDAATVDDAKALCEQYDEAVRVEVA